MTMGSPRVGVLMGSDSDLPVMARCAKVLEEYGLDYDLRVLSAHRSPEEAARFAREARDRGIQVIICAAGGAAHLAGAVAAQTTLPVIGVPLVSSPLQGFDALLSTVQMPPGVPVASVAIGSAGAKNAGHLAARILALGDAEVASKVDGMRARLADAAELDIDPR